MTWTELKIKGSHDVVSEVSVWVFVEEIAFDLVRLGKAGVLSM